MHTALEQQRAAAPSAIHGFLTRIVDITLIALGAAAAAWFSPGDGIDPSDNVAIVASTAVFAMILFPAFGVARIPRDRATGRIVFLTVSAWLLALAGSAIVMFAMRGALPVPPSGFLLWAAASGIALVAFRLAVCATVERIVHVGERTRPVAIVGGGAHCVAVLERIAQSPSARYRAAAVLDPDRSAQPGANGIEAFSTLDAFAAHVRAHAIPEVWIALPITETSAIVRVLDTFRHDLVDVRLVPDVSQLAMFDGAMVDLVGAPAINLVASPLSPRALLQKAIFDRLFAAAVLVGTAPLLLAIALAVRLSSPGPVLFRQLRKGANGKAFAIYKFRTMHMHADADGGVRQATPNDPRVTRIGAFLRRTSLDEMPQFINVLRGEMSVVGPRPHALEHDDLYHTIVDGYIHRYRVKPGITGWAQINGLRGETDRIEKMQRRVEADLHYLRNWSFALDMRIVAATITSGWTHHNAY
ncbi:MULTISPECIES: undecaprenyl-phosphate glucose phosphotransferase [unclassified Burkholderia]|uniref:undecaprenyl-phosphate glucose phosphotransferase n=1 Tax=unclassified Burkholderia TaxID=2613784 RepID=UPI000F57C5E0|nr:MULTISPECIES: undecaprenyl-phosphate glucose phosphotransferase [unclassified Burkholderia]RQR92542.1 undecaprenyl-phosphate glucose phosphotransferase [Burkholderia sp. Bp8994]RQS30500.1 undecaprenyl-phosphate glucose phosphotransferase [Burkholderia sp. Bp8995]RQS40111.1 undecaprenyl-phosphate glucose phosphotransferase [Burkholderia sp. Bp8990]RQS48810.1 undecaprenyl-phosphate glucose phosphotransferase [Burkholderia sp. Bp8989]RQS60826.1 undecaprenyl-phosphate glucose phosphotransferase